MLDEAVTGFDAGTRAGVQHLLQIVKAESDYQMKQLAISHVHASLIQGQRASLSKTRLAVEEELAVTERPHDAEVDHRVVLISTRSYDEAEFFADRIALMLAGRVLIHDVPARIRSTLGAGYELIFQMPTRFIAGAHLTSAAPPIHYLPDAMHCAQLS